MSILKGFTILAIAITWNVKPVNAQECQPLKVETSQIVVANDAAELRKEADVDTGEETNGRPVIAKGDKLTAIKPGQEGSVKQKDDKC